MAIDLFGPADAGAARTVAIRPAEAVDTIVVDSFFQPCLGGAGTGTPVTPSWLNRVTAALRSVVRRSSGVETNADPDVLSRAIRSQRMNFIPAPNVAGTATAITLTPDMAFQSKDDLIGTPVCFVAPLASAGPVMVSVSGFSDPLTWPDGAPIALGDYASGALLRIVHDGGAYRLATGLGPVQVLALTSWASRKTTYIGAGTHNYTVPSANRADGKTDIEVELQAGGGGGGASGDGSSGGIAGNIGAGGGGGAFAKKKITGLTPGSTITIILGAPGISAAAAAGTAGANSSFGTYFTLGGGGGGAWGANTRAAGGAGGTLVSGTVDEYYAGAPGGFSGPNSASVTPSDVITGYGRGGTAHEGLVAINATGSAGIGYGAGGTGASGGSGLKGGDGAPPKCIIRA